MSGAEQPNSESPGRTMLAALRFPLCGLVVVLAVLAVYGRTIGYEFLDWDDDLHVTINPHFAELSWSGLAAFWRGPYVHMYAPLSYMFWAGEVWLSRFIHGADVPLDPRIFHAGNVLLHTLACLTVWGLLRQLVGAAGPALIGTLIFALHPLQVESVAWIGETRGLLSTLLGLWALTAYLRTFDSPRRLLWYALASGCFVLALLAKPSAVTIPLIAALLAIGWQRQSWTRVAIGLLPWFLLAGVCVIVAKTGQKDSWIGFVTPRWQRPFIAGDALTFYLRKLVLPTNLGFDYGRTPQRMLTTSWVYVAWLIPVGLALVAWASSARRLWFTAIGIAVAGLLPVLGLVPFLYQDISTVADRYVYLAMFGVSLGVAAWLARHWSTAMVACWSLALGMWAMMSVQQCATWHDNFILFGHGLENNPRSFMAHYTLALIAHRAGNLDEAEAQYRSTLDLSPKYAFALNGLGTIQFERGQTKQAIVTYREAVRYLPNGVDILLNLGNALRAEGQPVEGLQQLQQALRVGPEQARPYVEIGKLHMEEGHLPEAMMMFRQALTVQPRDPQAHFRLGEALVKTGQYDQAATEFQAAIEAEPRLAEAQNNLGALYFLRGQYPQAIEHCAAALEVKPSLIEARYNRGTALLLLGRREEGIAELKQALRWLEADSPVAERIRQELAEAEAAPTL